MAFVSLRGVLVTFTSVLNDLSSFASSFRTRVVVPDRRER